MFFFGDLDVGGETVACLFKLDMNRVGTLLSFCVGGVCQVFD